MEITLGSIKNIQNHNFSDCIYSVFKGQSIEACATLKDVEDYVKKVPQKENNKRSQTVDFTFMNLETAHRNFLGISYISKRDLQIETAQCWNLGYQSYDIEFMFDKVFFDYNGEIGTYGVVDPTENVLPLSEEQKNEIKKKKYVSYTRDLYFGQKKRDFYAFYYQKKPKL